MPRKSSYEYNRDDAERYIKFLGCWSYANPTDAVNRRNPADYKSRLRKVIENNKSRTDAAGRMETAAALDALAKLGQ